MDVHLQVELLSYFRIGKPLRGAATREQFRQYNRKQIKRMKNALFLLGMIEKIPGMKTSGQLYRITKLGKKHLKDVEGANDEHGTV